MSIMAMTISMMFYLGKVEKELPAIINSYYVWDYYESEKYGRISMLKFRPFIEMKKAIEK